MADDLDFGATLRGHSPGQKVFGRYTLRKILGRGGMGIVWLAYDEDLERDIALKFLPEVVAADAQLHDALHRIGAPSFYHSVFFQPLRDAARGVGREGEERG